MAYTDRTICEAGQLRRQRMRAAPRRAATGRLGNLRRRRARRVVAALKDPAYRSRHLSYRSPHKDGHAFGQKRLDERAYSISLVSRVGIVEHIQYS